MNPFETVIAQLDAAREQPDPVQRVAAIRQARRALEQARAEVWSLERRVGAAERLEGIGL